MGLPLQRDYFATVDQPAPLTMVLTALVLLESQGRSTQLARLSARQVLKDRTKAGSADPYLVLLQWAVELGLDSDKLLRRADEIRQQISLPDGLDDPDLQQLEVLKQVLQHQKSGDLDFFI